MTRSNPGPTRADGCRALQPHALAALAGAWLAIATGPALAVDLAGSRLASGVERVSGPATEAPPTTGSIPNAAPPAGSDATSPGETPGALQSVPGIVVPNARPAAPMPGCRGNPDRELELIV